MHKIIDTLPGKKNALYDTFNYSGCSWDVCAGQSSRSTILESGIAS